MAKCVYCSADISDNRALDVCNSCGIKVWGDKMFQAILSNMEDARDTGNLCNSNL